MTTPPTPLPRNSISEEKQLTRNWIIFGVIAGILADVAYAGAIAPIPFIDSVRIYLGMAFGPLLSLAFIGIYHFFRLHRKTVTLQAATIFAIIAGTIVNLMLVVQSAIFQTIPLEARSDLGLAFDGVNMVQLGMDVSWDIYLSLATILIGIAMFSHPRFGMIWGAAALLIGGGLLVFNLATFPIPPAEAGSLDLGPLSGLLYLFVSIRVLTSLKWVDEKLAT
ncbi:MAG: hypothetical protein PVJ21_04625 [Anaerolineales bacterium]